MNRTIMLTLCITALLYSCTATKSSSDFSNEIFVDVEQSVELPLQRGRIIPLETSDSSLLYDIVSIDQVKDKYFIRSRNKILTFDTEGNYLYNISGIGQGNKGHSLHTGFLLFDFMNCDDNGGFITYWEALSDTIYAVVNDSMVQPKYLVNFGEYAIPAVERLNKDVYDLIDYVNKPENQKLATLIRYVYEEENYLYFVFSCEDSVRLTLYNKETHNTTTYILPAEVNGGKYRLASFLKVDKDKLIMALEDCENIENNQSLFIINKKELCEKSCFK